MSSSGGVGASRRRRSAGSGRFEIMVDFGSGREFTGAGGMEIGARGAGASSSSNVSSGPSPNPPASVAGEKSSSSGSSSVLRDAGGPTGRGDGRALAARGRTGGAEGAGGTGGAGGGAAGRGPAAGAAVSVPYFADSDLNTSFVTPFSVSSTPTPFTATA